jgi:hypothetical protein
MALLLSTSVAASSALPAHWSVYEQTTLPNGNLNFHPTAHGATFAFPDASSSSPAYVNYLLGEYTTSLTESNTVSATFTITTSSLTTAFLGNPDGGNPANSFVRLFIQANLPEDGSATCGVGHKNVLNYWWADVNSYTFIPGSASVTMTVSLDPANWSGICGNQASANTAGFDLALANIKYVGLSFGSNSFFSNGLGVDGGTGTATFQLTSFTIA